MIRIETNFDDAAAYFQELSDRQMRTVLHRSINKTASGARTQAIRSVKKVGNFSTVGYVRSKTKQLSRAGGAKNSASFGMKSGWSTLTAHPHSPKYSGNGKAFKRAVPWGNKVRLLDAFYAGSGANGRGLPARRTTKKRFPIKVYYGANAAKELSRLERTTDAGSVVEKHIADKLPVEIIRYGRVYHDQLKAKHRL